MKRQMGMGFNRWMEWYNDFLDQKRLLAGAIRRMQQLQLSRAWEQWQVGYRDYFSLSLCHPDEI